MSFDKRKSFYLIVDTETTINRHVFDFGAAIVDRKGKIYQQIAVVVNDFKSEEFFHDKGNTGFFALKNLRERHEKYNQMLENGDRVLASVLAINKWLIQAKELYGDKIHMTAYNINFDINVCHNSGINLSIFPHTFCLWNVSCKFFAKRKAYSKFCIKNKYFTEKLNMKTNAEVMSHYLTGRNLVEPHTALEDVLYFELPILLQCLRQKKSLQADGYSWREYQLPLVVERAGVKL